MWYTQVHPHFILLAAVGLVLLQIILFSFGCSGLEVLNALPEESALVGGE